jgi:hypothetical protein
MGSTRSPLDPLVRAFLQFVLEEAPGFSPTSRARVAVVAASLDVPPELVDALFVSAKSRGFLQPIPHGRVRIRWQVSAAGRAFLAEGDAAAEALISTARTSTV